MSYHDEMIMDVAALEQFAWEVNMDVDYPVEPRPIVEADQKRLLRNKKGQYTAVWGDLYAYDEQRNVFVPNPINDCAVSYVVDALPCKSATSDPVGYHNLTAADL